MSENQEEMEMIRLGCEGKRFKSKYKLERTRVDIKGSPKVVI